MTEASTPAGKQASLISRLRASKKARLTLIGILIAIIIFMLATGAKFKGLLIAVLVILVGAFGMTITDYDLDIATLIHTGSVSESRVENKKGMKVIGTECAPAQINCANFATQSTAQALYEKCATKIASDNDSDNEKVKNVDIYGLDGDKDGNVCEALSNG